MDVSGEIEDCRLNDCLAVLEKVKSVRGEPFNVVRISPQGGGLFNYLLRIDTDNNTLFFKQYLDNVPNEIYALPDVPASVRSRLAYDVQRIAFEETRDILQDAVPEILYYDEVSNALLMDSAPGDTPLIDLLSTGIISPLVSTILPTVLAKLHHATYGVYDTNSIFANRDFRNFKLGIQYDDIAARLDVDEARCVMACKNIYMNQARCVTHGDINSRNIMLNDRSLSVIDFEQSHLGTPAYDLAYILCEVYIAMIAAGMEDRVGELFSGFLDTYFQSFNEESRTLVDKELTCHFAVQVIYRFWGPSRKSWTFYIDDALQSRILAQARRILTSNIPLTSAL